MTRLPRAAAAIALALALGPGTAPLRASAQTQAEAGQLAEMSEAERKRVFREVGDALVRAEREASRRYADDPQSMDRVHFEDQLAERYKREIAAKHGLTRDDLVRLGAEGFEKRWRAH